MSRVQLALNVEDLSEAIAFYQKLFKVEPHKVRSDYANVIVSDPPLKLVLIAGKGEPGSLNHVGVEVASAKEVVTAAESAEAAGLQTTLQEKTSCCYALQDKVWVHGPDIAWEVYTVLDEEGVAGAMSQPVSLVASAGASCGVNDICCP
jgi:predicted enzyme related to lactoylglutathione lyase